MDPVEFDDEVEVDELLLTLLLVAGAEGSVEGGAAESKAMIEFMFAPGMAGAPSEKKLMAVFASALAPEFVVVVAALLGSVRWDVARRLLGLKPFKLGAE